MGYLYKGDAVLKGNLSVATGKPLDERSVVQNSTELLTISAAYAYNGMPVVSIDDAAIYILLDKENITSLDGWKKIGYVTIDGTNIDLSSYVSKEELEENNTSLLATIDAKIKTAINDVFTKIPLNEINDESYFSGTASGKNRFIVTDEDYVIGYIDVIVNKETTYNITQIFTTTLLLNEGTFINGSNNTLHVYLRNYDLRTSEWDNWREQFIGSGSSEIADGSIDEAKLSTSVNEALLKKFEFSELHTAPKGKCIVTNGGKVVGYADTVTSGDADKITQIMCTTMVQSGDDLNTFVGGDGTSMKTYKRYYSIQYEEWDDWEEIQIGGGGTTISDPITSTEIDNICN